jgi:dehydrogenase/reductase SDR family protein 1
MSTVNLKDKVCVVTGATRGIGRGIALQLGAAGAKVYLTGRTEDLLRQVAQEVEARGGTPVPVVLDHSNDQDVKNFFSKITNLDVLVNNAFAGVGSLHSAIGKSFWELDPIEQWDSINGIGLRGHYLCTVYAAR